MIWRALLFLIAGPVLADGANPKDFALLQACLDAETPATCLGIVTQACLADTARIAGAASTNQSEEWCLRAEEMSWRTELAEDVANSVTKVCAGARDGALSLQFRLEAECRRDAVAVAVRDQGGVNAAVVRACFTRANGSGVGCVGDAANRCQKTPEGGTTLGITHCLMAESDVWDDLREGQLHLRLAELTERDDGSADALGEAEEAWIAFRKADCHALFMVWQQGTMRSNVAANCNMWMTAHRAFYLRDLGGKP